MTLFAVVQIGLAAIVLIFCVVGAFGARSRRRRMKMRHQAHHWAATIILDGGPNLDGASHDLARLPLPILAEVLQRLSVDTSGEARRRLRVVAQQSGLTRRVERLSRRRSWKRRAQAAHLLMLLPSGSPQRNALLRDPHPFVRARAIESVSPSGVQRFAELLIESLEHESPAIRSAAQHALARGGADCVPPIIDALERAVDEEKSTDASQLMLEVAVEVPDPRLAGVLAKYATHADPRHRRLVAASLGGGIFLAPEALLAALLADDDPDVRAEAARAAGDGGIVAIAPALGRLLADQQWQVRRESGAALARLGPTGRVVLRNHLSDKDAFASDMARHVLAQLSGLGDENQANTPRLVA